MDIGITANPSRRAAYVNNARAAAAQAEKKSSPVPSTPQDTVSISPEARAAMAKQAEEVDSVAAVEETESSGNTATTFTSFAEEFNRVTAGYSAAVREHYAGVHAENLTYDSPSTHVWNKYKNPESPDFRSDMSEDERAWAYDHELDLLNGGRHLQFNNPYVFDNPPTLSQAAMQANQACREQIDQAIQSLFAKNGIEVPKDAQFQLTVDSSYNIRVRGLEDEELAESIEKVLNTGDNGKNLYDHLRVTSPSDRAPRVDFADGHLADVDTRWELDEEALNEVKKQTSPVYARYIGAYDPHHSGLLGVMTIPGRWEPSQEEIDRMDSAMRIGGPEIAVKLREQKLDTPVKLDKYASIDPDGQIRETLYWSAFLERTTSAQVTIADYYADAHRENSSYPLKEAIQHIKEKYQFEDSPIFRFDLPPAQRNMYYRQEMALLTGGKLSLYDPYALASVGGALTEEGMQESIIKAVNEKMDAMLEEQRRSRFERLLSRWS